LQEIVPSDLFISPQLKIDSRANNLERTVGKGQLKQLPTSFVSEWDVIRMWASGIRIMADRKLQETQAEFLLMSRDLQESKARLEEAQRVAHVGYWIWNLDTDRVTWSDETYRIFGLTPQEGPIDLATVRELIHPEDRESVFQTAEAAVLGGVRPDSEHRVLRPDGEVRIVHSLGDLKRDPSGKPHEMFGTVQDITDRKRAEEALQRTQFYLSAGQRLAHMGSWAFNAAGFDYWSSEWFEVHGLDPSGKPPTLEEYLDRVHPEDREFTEKEIQKMLADHRGFDFMKRIVRPDGKIRHVRCVGVPVIEQAVFKGSLGTAIDVTEQELLAAAVH
jgi:PAS domain S-box-containing protein